MRRLIILILAFGGAMPLALGGAAAVAQGTLAWMPCTDAALSGWECGRLTVPRDYQHPSRGTFHVAVARLRAIGPRSQRIGTLFVDAGGPGLSTIAEAPARASRLPAELRLRFDFVAWDPRGVGRSNPLVGCTEAAADVPIAGPVAWSTVLARLRTAQAAANRDCEMRYPDALPYIGTNNTVRDLDALRAAVGDQRLTYWAPSYGSRIGYVYALAYPTRVRAILMSGAVHPHGTLAEFTKGLGVASDDAAHAMLAAHPGLSRIYARVAKALDVTPLALPSGNRYSRWDLSVSMFLAGANERAWTAAAALLSDLDTALLGAGDAQAQARARVDAAPRDGGMSGQGAAERFINCLDYADRPTHREQLAIASEVRAASPMTGAVLSALPMECEGMTTAPDPVPRVTQPVAEPGMLIITADHDGRTPLRWTRAMASAFPGSRVVVYRGGNHMTFLEVGSRCTDDAGVQFLVTARLPERDRTCPSTYTPE